MAAIRKFASHRVLAPALAVLAMGCGASAARALDIRSSETGPRKVGIVIDNEAALAEEDARVAMALIAYDACDYNVPEMGEFAAQEDKSSFRYTQQAECPPPEAADESAPETLAASQKQAIEDEVRLLTEEHFHLVDAGRYEVALRDLDGNNFRKNEWQENREAFAAMAGRLQQIEVTDVTIDELPASAMEPEIYITVHFTGRYERVPIECGAFRWAPAPNGEYRVIAAGQNYITSERFERLAPLEQAVIDLRMGCRRSKAAQP